MSDKAWKPEGVPRRPEPGTLLAVRPMDETKRGVHVRSAPRGPWCGRSLEPGHGFLVLARCLCDGDGWLYVLDRTGQVGWIAEHIALRCALEVERG